MPSTQPQSVVSWSAPSMGGRLGISIKTDAATGHLALRAAELAGRRIEAWAGRLTRFETTSDLSRLNDSAEHSVRIRPTLAAVLDWAATASERTHGTVDATLLAARLAAESGVIDAPARAAQPSTSWRLETHGRTRTVRRPAGVRFDLDGLAKGWLADRGASLLGSWSGVVVDADGDMAVRADPGVEWLVDVADPNAANSTDAPLASLRLSGGDGWPCHYGVATSGTTVHRWRHADGTATHHLIDPRTNRPAATDVVQATVIAPSAREAEVLAKAALILGSGAAYDFLDHSAAHAALLLLESGDVCCLPGIERWLA
jgi:thiamine biosynthesis lipoprotein